MRVSDRLRIWRLNRGMTQDMLARELGVHLSSVSKWERGAMRIPERVRSAMRRSNERSDCLSAFGGVFARLMRPGDRERERRRKVHMTIGREQGSAIDVARRFGVSTMTVYRARHYVLRCDYEKRTLLA